MFVKKIGFVVEHSTFVILPQRHNHSCIATACRNDGLFVRKFLSSSPKLREEKEGGNMQNTKM